MGTIELYEGGSLAAALQNTIKIVADGELEAVNDAGDRIGFPSGWRYELVTQDNTPTALAVVTIPTSSAWTFVAHVVGHRDDYSAAAGRVLVSTVRRASAGNVVLVGNAHQALLQDSTPAVNIATDITTSAWRLVVTGVAGEDWVWLARVMRLQL